MDTVPRKPQSWDNAAIFARHAGRQLWITTGQPDTSDRGEGDLARQLVDCPVVQFSEPPFSPRPDRTPLHGGTKESIDGFTARSRRRLKEWVHALRRDAESLFLTLTYHETDPHPRDAKTQLDTFCKRLFRKYPEASVIWKMEPQDRGHVHFHLLVFGVPYIPAQGVSAVWHEVTDETSDEHKKSGVDVERGVARNDGKLAAYLAKYMSKCFTVAWEDPGRFWGIRNRSELPVADWTHVCDLADHAEAQQIIYDLLERWGVDLPEYTSIPSLTINCRGDPAEKIACLP